MGTLFSKAYDRVMKPVEQRRFGKYGKSLSPINTEQFWKSVQGQARTFHIIKMPKKLLPLNRTNR